MKKQVTKIFVSLFVALIATSSVAILPTNATDKTTDQNAAMYFMENILPIDLSQYTINIISDDVLQGFPLGDNNRQIHDILYGLISENSEVHISFSFEKGIMTSCLISELKGQKYPQHLVYANTLDAVVAFLEKYQTYTKIDSSNLIAMLDNVDIKKDVTTITAENIKLVVENYAVGEQSYTLYTWTYVFNGVDYASLAVGFNKFGQLCSVGDSLLLFTVNDTSINISLEQAVNIAIENLKFYSYEMPDGSVVKDFKVSKDAVMAELVVTPVDFVDYELRPYWDVSLYLDEVYPGNVFGIKVFIWANNGEIISYSNMATGGTDYIEDINYSDVNSSQWVVVAVVAVAVATLVIGAVVVVKKRQR